MYSLPNFVPLSMAFMILFLSTVFTNLTLPSTEATHALYISVLEIDHRNKSNEAGVNIKVFENDLADALKNEYRKTFNLEDSGSCSEYIPEIQEYFLKHITININGVNVMLRLTSCEKNSDSIWFYCMITTKDNWQEVEVKADYLMELFPTQSNVVSVYHGDQKKFLRITNDNKTQSVSF